MAYKFDRNKYKKMLDEMYGAGSYDSGLSKAREIGTLKAQAGFAESEFKSALSERKSSSLTGDYGTNKEDTISDLVESDLKKYIKDSLKTGGGYPSQEAIDAYASDLKNKYTNPRDYALNAMGKMEADSDISLSDVKKEMDKNKKKKNEKGAVDKTIDFFKNIGKDTDDNGRAQGLDFLDKTLGRASNSATEWLFGKKFTEEQNERYMEQGNDQVKAKTYASSKPAETALEKGSDIAGAILGSLGPYAMGYGAADVAMKGVSALRNINNPIVRDLVRGGIAGGGVGTGLAVTRDVSGEDMNAGDYAKTIGLEAALGGTFDAGLGIAGRAIMKRLGKGQAPDAIARELNVPRSQVDETAQKVTQAQQTQAAATPTNPESPLLNLNLNTTRSALDDIPVQTNELDNIIAQMDTTFKQRQTHEDAFVQERMQPFAERLQRSAEAEIQWKSSVDQAKTAAKQIKDSYGKIIVPESNWKDWGTKVPPSFRAKKGETKGVDLYTFAEQEGFSNVDEAVEYLRNIDTTSKTKLKDLKSDDYITPKQMEELENAARQEFQGSDTAKGLDSYFESLLNMQKQAETATPSASNLVPETAATVEEAPQLLRGNLQSFNTRETNPLVSASDPRDSITAIESQSNPIRKVVDKFYENYVNRNYSATVAERQIIKKNYDAAVAAKDTKRMKELTDQLKNLKKNGSELDKALQNESASAAMSKNFLNRHFNSLQKSLGKEAKKNPKVMADALEYQMAKNLLWIKDNVNADYALPKGWSWERLADIEAGGAGKFDNFTESFRNLTQDWRDTMLDYGMIDQASYEALSKNPYYVPMFKDTGFRADNIDLGASRGSNSSKRSTDPFILFELSEGDMNTFYKNPLESVVSNTFTLHKNALKNDTAQQAYKLAQMDNEGFLAKEITEKEFKSDTKGGLEVNVNGEKKYVRLQDDIMKMIKENDVGLDMNAIAKVSTFFARMKTSSLEYQATSLLRDIPQSYLTSQITNPFRYAAELGKAVKNGSSQAKELGAAFEKAYADSIGGIDPKKISQEYTKQMGGDFVDSSRSESVTKLAGMIKKIASIPFKPAQKIGQISDEAVREVEVQETARRFYKQNAPKIEALESELAQLDEQLAKASNATTDFDPALQGIDQVAGRKSEIEAELRDMRQSLRREQTYRGRDVINYSRMGRGKVAQGIRKYIMFANTTTQSKDKLFRTFAQRPIQTGLKATALVAPVIAAQKIMLENMSDSDRELYDNTPGYMKQLNYVFVNDGKVITLPKIHELALVSNPIEEAIAGQPLNESGQLALKELVPYQMGNFAQALIPNAGEEANLSNAQMPGAGVLPFVDVITNQKTGFNNKPISYSAEFESDPSKQTANEWTTDVAKALAGDKPNADRLEYLIRQLGGDAGKYGLYLADYANNPTDDKLTALLQNINPLQDRYYTQNSRFFKAPLEEKAK